MGKFGTLSVLEDLADVHDVVRGNEDMVARRFAEALDIYNTLMQEMLDGLVSYTDQAQLPIAGSDEAIIQELDEWGRADASKAASAGQVGFPLRIYGSAVQWTATYRETAPVSAMAAQLDAHAAADRLNLQALIRSTLFRPTNTAAYFDRLQTKLTYPLRALTNGDGEPIPVSPNGTTFDPSTHTHYMASSTYTAAATSAVVQNVVEHGVDGKIELWIARADEATVRAFTSPTFSPYLDARVTVTSAAQIGTESLDVTNPDNRAIGVFDGAEVWVKPWVPQDYCVVVDRGARPGPLGVRTRTGNLTEGLGAFGLRDEHGHHPLQAQNLGREVGIAAWGRWKAAVSLMDNSVYSAP